MSSFAQNGGTFPWYGGSTYPSATHFPETNTTWVAWESYAGYGRTIRCRTVNMCTGAVSPVYNVGGHSLNNDDHGVPSVERDQHGHVWSFYGSHNSTITASVTTVPDSPASWVKRKTFSGAYSYPSPTLVDGTIYFLYRKRLSSSQRGGVWRGVVSPGGNATWGADDPLVDLGSGTRTYLGTPIQVGTDIHFHGTRSDYGDNYRRDRYHFVLDTVTGAVRNAAGSFVKPAASLPVTLADANAHCRVLAQTTQQTDLGGFCVTPDGTLHMVSMDGLGTAWTLVHQMHPPGGPWTAPQPIVTVTQSRYNLVTLVAREDNRVELWYPEDEAQRFARGGNMTRCVWDGAAWGTPETILEATDAAFDQPTAVRNGHRDARVAWCEITQDSQDTSGGDRRLYLYGDSGFVSACRC